jgi:flagellar biosynthesis regulator FlbT
MSEEVVRKIIEEINEALKSGKKVIINGTVVEKIDVAPSRRTVVIIINDKITMYPSQLIRAKKVIL